MKISSKRIGSLAIAALVVLYAATLMPTAAEANERFAQPLTNVMSEGSYSKDEIIYVNLAHDGSVDAIYAVNSFDVVSGGTITDQGNYSEVINLTTTEPIRRSGTTVSTEAAAGEFYYEGVLEKRDIPWEISVNYSLDGNPIDGAELAGQSGQLQIDIGVHQKSDTNKVWRDNYAVQASLSLDSENCKHIEAPDATIATVGSDKQLSYIILPGKEKDFTITADVTSFELGGISFNMIPLSLSIDDPDTTEIKDKLHELQDGAVELDDGAFDLDDGAIRLDDGAGNLDDGVTRLRDGVEELTDGIDGVDGLSDGADDLRGGASDLLIGSGDIKKGANRLYDGVGELENGACAFSGGLSQLNGQSVILTTGSAQIKAGLEQLAGAVSGIDGESMAEMQNQASQLKSASQDYLNTLDMLIVTYEQHLSGLYSLGYSGAQTAHESYGDDVTSQIQALSQTIAVLKDLRANYEMINTGVTQMTDSTSRQGVALPQLATGIKNLSDQYGQLDTGITDYTEGVSQLYASFGELTGGISDLSDGISELNDGAEDLQDGTRELYDGTYDLQEGVRKLSDGTAELSDGVVELGDGAVELKDGTTELKDGTLELLDGTNELREKTADMDKEVDEKIDEMIDEYRNKKFDPISFVDESNRDVNSVQFVMKTAEISVEDAVKDSIKPKAEITFIQRFINLFDFSRKE